MEDILKFLGAMCFVCIICVTIIISESTHRRTIKILQNQNVIIELLNNKTALDIIDEVVEDAAKQTSEKYAVLTGLLDYTDEISKLQYEIETLKQQIRLLCEKNNIEIPFESELHETGRGNNADTPK